MTFERETQILEGDFEDFQKLLRLEDISGADKELCNDLGGRPDDYRLIFSDTFENGVALSVALRSGNSNYWLEAEFARDGNYLGSVEPDFELSPEMEFAFGEDTYRVYIELL